MQRFLFDRCHDLDRIETLQDDHRHTVGHSRQNAQHASKAVKQRYGQAEAVLLGKPLVFPDPETVVADIVMGQFNALGKSGGAGCVLHIDHVMRVERGLAPTVIGRIGHDAHVHDLRYGVHSPVFFLAQEEDPFKVRKSGAF